MRFVGVCGCLILLVSCASPDERLFGTWQSNGDLTLAKFKADKPLGPEASQTISNIFGKLVLTYGKRTVQAYLPPAEAGDAEWTFSSSYRVVASDSHSVVIVSDDELTGQPKITHIHFDTPTRYYIYLEGSGNREFFDKVP